MSRVGRQPITVPSGTKVELSDGNFVAEGPKGKVSQSVFEGFPVEIDGSEVRVSRPGDEGPHRARHGLLRSLLANAVRRCAATRQPVPAWAPGTRSRTTPARPARTPPERCAGR
jgi:hypothetical protein